MQFLNPTSYPQVTALVVARKSLPLGDQSFMCKYLGYTDFCLGSGRSDQSNFNAFSGTLLAFNVKCFSELNGLGWQVFALRYNGTTLSYWIGDVPLFQVAAPGLSAVSISDLLTWFNNPGNNQSKSQMAIQAIYNRGLTNTEMLAAIQSMAYRASASGIVLATNNIRVLVPEGDSITEGNGMNPYAWVYATGGSASPKVVGSIFGVAGSQVTDMNTRAAALDATLPASFNGRKFILSVMIGRNDMGELGGLPVSTFLSNLSAYLDARRAKGWKVVLCTILPSTLAGFNANRNAANATIRTWVGTHCDVLCDFAADPTMGPDAAAANTSLYTDGTHPTQTGQNNLAAIYGPIINAM